MVLPGENSLPAQAFLHRTFPGLDIRSGRKHMKPYLAQIADFFLGKRREFDIPLDVRGTDFQFRVWDAISAIPFGETRSYSEVADSIGRPGACRAVGGAAGANVVPLVIPCHRVTGKGGLLGGFSAGLVLKRWLLKFEGGGFGSARARCGGPSQA